MMPGASIYLRGIESLSIKLFDIPFVKWNKECRKRASVPIRQLLTSRVGLSLGTPCEFMYYVGRYTISVAHPSSEKSALFPFSLLYFCAAACARPIQIRKNDFERGKKYGNCMKTFPHYVVLQIPNLKLKLLFFASQQGLAIRSSRGANFKILSLIR